MTRHRKQRRAPRFYGFERLTAKGKKITIAKADRSTMNSAHQYAKRNGMQFKARTTEAGSLIVERVK